MVAALSMAMSAAVLFYTDDQLNLLGIGSPLGIGDSVTCTGALWLQPWLLVAARAGLFHSWVVGLGSFVSIGIVSGAVLATLSALIVRRWRVCFWPFVILFAVLTVASASYATQNFRRIEVAQLRDHATLSP